MLFVTLVTTEVKSPGFDFLKKEYSFVYARVHFNLFFSNSAWYKNTLNTTVMLSFSQNKTLKLLDVKAKKFSTKNDFPNLSHAILQTTLWVSDRKTIGKFGRFRTGNRAMA